LLKHRVSRFSYPYLKKIDVVGGSKIGRLGVFSSVLGKLFDVEFTTEPEFVDVYSLEELTKEELFEIRALKDRIKSTFSYLYNYVSSEKVSDVVRKVFYKFGALNVRKRGDMYLLPDIPEVRLFLQEIDRINRNNGTSCFLVLKIDKHSFPQLQGAFYDRLDLLRKRVEKYFDELDNKRSLKNLKVFKSSIRELEIDVAVFVRAVENLGIHFFQEWEFNSLRNQALAVMRSIEDLKERVFFLHEIV